jgi:hypothetical protein
VYERQGEHLFWPVKRPNTFTEKVALPECLCMDMQEIAQAASR